MLRSGRLFSGREMPAPVERENSRPELDLVVERDEGQRNTRPSVDGLNDGSVRPKIRNSRAEEPDLRGEENENAPFVDANENNDLDEDNDEMPEMVRELVQATVKESMSSIHEIIQNSITQHLNRDTSKVENKSSISTPVGSQTPPEMPRAVFTAPTKPNKGDRD